MADVVLTSTELGWYQWAKQFAAHSRSRFKEAFRSKKPNRKEILRAYHAAARRVGRHGQLIISAGHGFSRGFSSGAVDLAPGNQLRLSSGHLKHAVKLLSKKDQRLVKTYQEIGKIIRRYHVRRVLFVSCNVGQSWDFLQQIADQWQATIVAYKPLVEVGYITIGRTKKYYVYLSSNPPRAPADQDHLTHNYPSTQLGNAWTITPRSPKKQ